MEGNVLGLTVESTGLEAEAEAFFRELPKQAIILPVYCGTTPPGAAHGDGRMIRKTRVVIGPPLAADVPIQTIRLDIRVLGDWVQAADHAGTSLTTVMIPGGSTPAGTPDTHS
jgi:hypothetical protein